MFTHSRPRQHERRGVVLVLVLGMLGLLAIIGVTFATFTGQSRVGARSFAQSLQRPPQNNVMDFALSQLIGDTGDIRSAIRGHSLARDMYGTDAANNGYLAFRPGGVGVSPYDYSLFYAVKYQQVPKAHPTDPDLYDILTNIRLDDPAFYGYNFTRWVMRFSYTGSNPQTDIGDYGKPVDATFEVVFDNNDLNNSLGSALADNVHRVLRVNPKDATTELDNPTLAARLDLAAGAVWRSRAAPPANLAVFPFTLDGRFLRAFNGPGVGVQSTHANFRYNGPLQKGQTPPYPVYYPGDPNLIGMDEDYDACDLENWFLAIQSADGQVIVPSFHRPGILRYTKDANGHPGIPSDWTGFDPESPARILRPRSIDHPQFASSFPDPVPNALTGSITFDVDNDSDGLTDSVWVDLGYPARTDERGQLYKPLFAFLVIGTNGRIPLNTAGNIAGANHSSASHLGNSPSELDPTYALQNAFDPTYGQKDNAGVDVRLTQLRNLLTGTRPASDPFNADFNANGDANWVQMGVDSNGNPVPFYMPNGQYDATPPVNPPDVLNGTDPITGNAAVVRNTQPVAGRWGESDIVQSVIPTAQTTWGNRVRAGLSRGYTFGTGSYPRDANDDNYNGFDPYPPPHAALPAGHQGEFDDWDWFDPTGSLILPVERIRRFVTPMDINGTGHVVTFTTTGTPPNKRGGDIYGRVTFLSYFRPPGLPGIIDVNHANATFGAIGSFTATTLRGVDVTALIRHTNDPAVDNTNNPTHGFDSYRFPSASPARLGGMPFNQNAGTKVPTYDNTVNGKPPGTDGLDDADEMNLYQPDGLDAPFGPADLEWLYRSHDVDGAQLSSRLKSLAPVSFSEKSANAGLAGDGLRRRRLVSTDSWEPNRYVWTTDNPRYNLNGLPGWDVPFNDNSRFIGAASAGFASLNVAASDITSAVNQSYPWLQFLSPYLYSTSRSPTNPAVVLPHDPVPHWPVPSPSIAQGEKKINLNFPLPVSNDPNEHVRRKWIGETYQLLKTILPPLAIDTPEELAQLSQFVVNIVDFRDPDGTMTRFVNPDVILVLGTVTGNPATTVTPTKLDYTTNSASHPANTWMHLEQFGMEYNPIAINETLAYSFLRFSGGAPTPVNRFFVELVNTLTQAATGTAATLDLSNWDLVITGDDPVSRPDPFTGQLLPIQTANYLAQIPLTSAAFTGTPSNVTAIPLPATGTPAAGYYYVIGNQPPDASSESKQPPVTQSLQSSFDPTSGTAPPGTPPTTLAPGYYKDPDNTTLLIGKPNNTYPTTKLPTPLSGKAASYWICLRRPANPFTSPNPTGIPAPTDTVSNPMVVVDCMRFQLVEGGGTGDTNGKVIKVGTNFLYSTQRTQPLRGGHAVASTLAGTNLDTRYGFSEQMAVPGISSTDTGLYKGNPITQQIYHTLTLANNQADPAWDYFPFHDRDFTSVAELLLVPGCPPGLFTKQFAEVAPSNAKPFNPPNVPLNGTTPPTALPAAGTNAAMLFTATVPHTFPYLVDKFFYTSYHSGGTTYGDRSSDGWFKIFEFLDVPSQAEGSIGPVAQGANFDWARQDLKPGLMNLNLIVDEEPLLALLGQQDSSFNQHLLNFTPVPFGAHAVPLPANQLPRVVTAVDANGTPLTSYEIGHAGHVYLPNNSANVKAAFAQFLKVRHGGSGFLFAYGAGQTGTPNLIVTPPPTSPPNSNLWVASDRPFRSLSFPDVDFTVMRPAALRPTVYTLPVQAATPHTQDPGIRNSTLYPGYATAVPPTGLSTSTPAAIVPPAIPARRFFQNPDAYSGTPPSNASDAGDPYVNTQVASAPSATPPATSITTGSLGGLTYNTVNLVNPVVPNTTYLGNSTAPDGGQHPYYRSEMLQRVMNLTTVRTHQYAVWITVGFFRVTRQGDPSLAYTNPSLAYDQLGPEVGLPGGKKTRYRSFFIVDRTKLTGFDPSAPGNYRDAVIYRQTIQ
jgi:hypothetical protein